MESEVIRRVNDGVDERPAAPHPRSTAGLVTDGSSSHGPNGNGHGSPGNGSGSANNGYGPPGTGSTPSIADRFADLLAPLSNRRRRGLIARLSVGYYEGWRPTRAEVTELVAEELRRSPR
jgi:hypothetical protein